MFTVRNLMKDVTNIIRNKLDEGIEKIKFIDVFKRYIAAHINSKFTPPIAVWDYDIKKLNLEELEFKVSYPIMDFLMMRKLQCANLIMDVDIIVIDKFTELPPSVIEKLVSNILEKKMDHIFVFSDKILNCHMVSSKILDSMTSFVVKI
ncbi:hypothetical protein [Clostridium estertheticum]|uniref:hypothetical protein n=1 Tax=Clostridium estertheticum TaxID=238834 RepID=UPI001C7D158E|nr:hypothetical protein [Clostridium estertheticum]MBX4263128.1 hypothetical protein [Clostridium estertheticum]WLC89441.1 hypothetical protein KTC95_04260 [Clostridium estertheticum]